MVHYAVDMTVEDAPVTNFLLAGISVLDNLGAWDWNLRLVSLVWFLIFMAIRNGIGERGGVEWYAMAHAAITGIGGVICAYLTFAMAEDMTGTPEPLAMVMCGGALTSFHRVLPTATLGYAVIDLLDGLKLGLDFLSHGLVLLLFALYMCENEKNEILSTMLALEFSSIFYNLVRAKFLTQAQSMMNLMCFVLSFFLCRVVFGPWSWYQIVKVLYNEGLREEALSCAPVGHRHFIFISGMFFHILNGYWFVKIVQKVQRKLSGKSKSSRVTMKITTTNSGNGENGHTNNIHGSTQSYSPPGSPKCPKQID